jgi:hypothetical protein
MGAGLIPVVPSIGGHTEFVPLKYQFHSFTEAKDSIAVAMDASFSERIRISDSVRRFSTINYIKRFQQIVKEISATDLTAKQVDLKKASPMVS